MNVETIDTTGRDELYMRLVGYVHSLNRRGVSVSVVAYSKHYASIEIQVIGKRGIARKIVMISSELDSDGFRRWVILTDKNQYKTENLSSIGGICRSVIRNVGVLVSKL